MTKRSSHAGTPCGATIALHAFFPSRSPVIPAKRAQACRWRHYHYLLMQTHLERLEGCPPTQRRPSTQLAPSLPDDLSRCKLFLKFWDAIFRGLSQLRGEWEWFQPIRVDSRRVSRGGKSTVQTGLARRAYGDAVHARRGLVIRLLRIGDMRSRELAGRCDVLPAINVLI